MNYNTSLGRYFSSKPLYLDGEKQKKPHVRKLMEQPRQMTQAGLWDEVTDTLCNLDFIQAKAAAKLTYELVDDFNKVLEVIPDNAENVQQERQRKARMEKYTQDLIACARGEIKAEDLEIPQSITPWAEEEIEREIQRIKSNPNRADKLRDFVNFLGQEVANLEMFATDISNFAYQQAWNYCSGGGVGKAAEKMYPSDIDKSLLFLTTKPYRPEYSPLLQVLKKLTGHTGSVTSVSITPDGRLAVSSSKDNTCIYWNLESGKIINTLTGHTHSVNCVCITPDGRWAISGSSDKTCILWNLDRGNSVHTLRGHTDWITSVSITPDGKKAVTNDIRGLCIIWDIINGILIQAINENTKVCRTTYIDNYGHESSFMSFGSIRWDYYYYKDEVNCSSISADGLNIFCGTQTGRCILMGIEKNEVLFTIMGHSHSISSISLTPDFNISISGSLDTSCMIWDLKKGHSKKPINDYSDVMESIQIVSTTRRRAISLSGDNSCILWNLENGDKIASLNRHKGKITTVCTTPSDCMIITGSEDRTCIIWNSMNGEMLRTLRGHTETVRSIQITPDGKRAITIPDNIDKSILWDIINGQFLCYLDDGNAVDTVCISSDGRTAVSSGVTVNIWDLTNGQKIKCYNGFYYNSISLLPDGTRAIIRNDKNTCGLINLRNGVEIIPYKHIKTFSRLLVITPDGKICLSKDWNTLSVWDVLTGQVINTFELNWEKGGSINITPDGKRAICTDYKTCTVRDIESGDLIVQTPIAGFASLLGANQIVVGVGLKKISLYQADRQILCPGIPIVTAREIWDFYQHRFLPLTADCPLCEHRFSPEQSVIDTINKTTLKAGLKPEDSPCLSLPKEAWDDPGLHSNCPKCGERLKFNPFFPAHL